MVAQAAAVEALWLAALRCCRDNRRRAEAAVFDYVRPAHPVGGRERQREREIEKERERVTSTNANQHQRGSAPLVRNRCGG